MWSDTGSSWSVDHVTGDYTAHIRSPTGLPTDPALTSHGVEQADELAGHLLDLHPPIDQVYSSPYYRCLQTISPYVSRRNARRNKEPAHDDGTPFSRLSTRVDAGLGEWYGQAHFEHPASAPLSKLSSLFADLDVDYVSSPAPRRCGSVPDDTTVEDFRAFTCGLSKYRRQTTDQISQLSLGSREPVSPDDKKPYQGTGFELSTRWVCEANSDCSFLGGGEERGWRFSGDESFIELGQEGLQTSTLETHSGTGFKQGEDTSSCGSRADISKL
ncbi:hypothetical protein NPX13_g6100 [Xylaria arbuscula]|uniref:Uncharacterized protein n=1 Tax=Xylaria arbuscula TaxID=114810 RepID=A0A9W8NCV6_9PEZI|nr:hypothetical protein NPX13_g6100 [Xylaria arbuscula]